MKYLIYKITNKINDRFYIGAHKTDNIDDGYMGSGTYIIRAIKKYGLEMFTKEILHEFFSEDEMFNKEAEIVTEEFVSRNDTYNLKIGGLGGFSYINNNGLSPVGSPEHYIKYREAFIDNGRKVAKITKERIEAGLQAHGFQNKKHTEETKQKIRNTLKKINHQCGKKNSQYGKPRSDEIKEKIRQTLISKPLIQCPTCKKESNNKGLMNRWHFDNCKLRKVK